MDGGQTGYNSITEQKGRQTDSVPFCILSYRSLKKAVAFYARKQAATWNEAQKSPCNTRLFTRLFVHAGGRFPRPFAGAVGTLFENAKLIFPLGAVETASAAIFIISGTTGLIAVKSRFLLHEQFKRPLLALCEIHSGCTSFPAGIKKRHNFLSYGGISCLLKNAISRLVQPCYGVLGVIIGAV